MDIIISLNQQNILGDVELAEDVKTLTILDSYITIIIQFIKMIIMNEEDKIWRMLNIKRNMG